MQRLPTNRAALRLSASPRLGFLGHIEFSKTPAAATVNGEGLGRRGPMLLKPREHTLAIDAVDLAEFLDAYYPLCRNHAKRRY